uniref:Uncharacterized protein n=1 Tax=Aegilops tauschii subsp. strangulata TaxID=200361 RepID=A0A453QPS8_AEGTS
LKDFFPTMEMRPNPQCSNPACLERQRKNICNQNLLEMQQQRLRWKPKHPQQLNTRFTWITSGTLECS